MSDEHFEQDLRDAVRSLAPPGAPDSLRQRAAAIPSTAPSRSLFARWGVAAGGAVAAAAAGGPASPVAPVDLNTATPEQLDALPGVGPATAAKIISFRQEHGPFHSVEELDAVPGIGPERIEQLKGLVLP